MSRKLWKKVITSSLPRALLQGGQEGKLDSLFFFDLVGTFQQKRLSLISLINFFFKLNSTDCLAFYTVCENGGSFYEVRCHCKKNLLNLVFFRYCFCSFLSFV